MEREPGYYWVRFEDGDEWEPAEIDGGGTLYVIGTDIGFDERRFAEIGDRISPPGARKA